VLSRFLEHKHQAVRNKRVVLQALGIVLLPFFLILKQPDLDTALVLYPIALSMFYFGRVNRTIVAVMASCAAIGLISVVLLFTGVVSHEQLRPVFTTVLKDYQYDRLNPNTYHQSASQTAIALGGWTGTGWHQNEFTGRQWLPASHTDSVFAAYSEQFGFIGVVLLLLFFFGLLYFSFQTTACAKDPFGRLLSAGIAVYLAIHVIVNIGMMCGLLPIAGVPLILITYGGSSVLSTMIALGILQSIYSRRYMF
jgi:rod shape determining protein RodA